MQKFVGTLYLVGTNGCGKTCVVNNITNNGRLMIQDQKIKVINEIQEVHDIGEIPQSAFGIIIVYDISSKDSFYYAQQVCETVYQMTEQDPNIFPVRVLLGTKRDLARSDRKVTYTQAVELKQLLDGIWQEVDALSHENLNNLLQNLKIHEVSCIRQIQQQIGIENIPILYAQQYQTSTTQKPWKFNLMRYIDNTDQLNDNYFDKLTQIDQFADPMHSPYQSQSSPHKNNNQKAHVEESSFNDLDFLASSSKNDRAFQVQYRQNDDISTENSNNMVEEAEEQEEQEEQYVTARHIQVLSDQSSGAHQQQILDFKQQVKERLSQQQTSHPYQNAASKQKRDVKTEILQSQYKNRKEVSNIVQQRVNENVRLHINPGPYEKFVLRNVKQIQKEQSQRINRKDIMIMPKQYINKNNMTFNVKQKELGQVHEDHWSGILRNKKISGFTNQLHNNNIIQEVKQTKIQREKPLVVLEVEVRDKNYEIPIYKNTDPRETARRFVISHKLHDSYIKIVQELIHSKLQVEPSTNKTQVVNRKVNVEEVVLVLQLNINGCETKENVYFGENAIQISRRLAQKYQVDLRHIHDVVCDLITQ